VRLTVAQLPRCSSAAAGPLAAGRRNRPDAPPGSSARPFEEDTARGMNPSRVFIRGPFCKIRDTIE